MLVSNIVSLLFEFVFWVIFIDCFLSWIPNLNRFKQPFLFIHNFSDLFLAPARKIIPPIGMLDISPIVVLIVLQICGAVICQALRQFGL